MIRLFGSPLSRLLCLLVLFSATAVALPPPPAAAQTVQAPDKSFKRIGGLEVRLDQLSYDLASQAPNPGAGRLRVAIVVRNPGLLPVMIGPNNIHAVLNGAGTPYPETSVRVAGQTTAQRVAARGEVGVVLEVPFPADSLGRLNQLVIRTDGILTVAAGSVVFDLPKPAASAAPAPAPTPAPAPAPPGGTALEPGFQALSAWAARVDKIEYEQTPTGPTDVTVTVRNISGGAQILSDRTFQATLQGDAGTLTMREKYRIETEPNRFTIGATLTIRPNQTARLRFSYPNRVTDQAPLRTLRMAELHLVTRNETASTVLPLTNFPAPSAAASPPAAAQGPLSAMFGDGWAVVRDQVQVRYSAPTQGRTDVVVRAVLQNRSSNPLTLMKAGIRPLLVRGNGAVISPFDIQLTTPASPQSNFSVAAQPGQNVIAEFSFRVGDELAQQDVRALRLVGMRLLRQGWTDLPGVAEVELQGYSPTLSTTNGRAVAGSFVEGGYLAVKPGAINRSLGWRDSPQVALTLEVRNGLGGRRSVNHNPDQFVLVDTSGKEYRSDGNFYGASATERLSSTVWLEKDQTAPATYVFPNFPTGAQPARLLIRDRSSGSTLASVDLSPGR